MNLFKEIHEKIREHLDSERDISERVYLGNIGKYMTEFFNFKFYPQLEKQEDENLKSINLYRQFRMKALEGDGNERNYEKPNIFAAKITGFLGKRFDDQLAAQSSSIIDYIMIIFNEKKLS